MKISPIQNFNIKSFLPERHASNPIYFSGQDSFESKIKKNKSLLIKEMQEEIETKGKLIMDCPEKFLIFTKTPSLWNAGYISLACDIDLEGAQISPIGSKQKPFTGVFDGAGHTVKNFKIIQAQKENSAKNAVYYVLNDTKKKPAGLFGYIKDSEIRNLNIKNAHIENQVPAGPSGGISAQAQHSVISNCLFDGEIDGSGVTGGIIGISEENNIERCGVTAKSITVKKEKAYMDWAGVEGTGGITGADLNSKMSEVFCEGDITGVYSTGGLIGHSKGTKIEYATYEGHIENATGDNVGALIGFMIPLNSNGYVPKQLSNIWCLSNIDIGVGEEDKKLRFSKTRVCTSLADLDTFDAGKNSPCWVQSKNSIPRLKFYVSKLTPEKIFFKDYISKKDNYKKSWEFEKPLKEDLPLKSQQYLDTLAAKSPEELTVEFSRYANKLRCNINESMTISKENSILEFYLYKIIKNPKMNLTDIYMNSSITYDIGASALLMLARLGKAFLFEEALNRDDVIEVIEKVNAFAKNSILSMMLNLKMDSSLFVFLNHPKTQNYLQRAKKESYILNPNSNYSELANIMLEAWNETGRVSNFPEDEKNKTTPPKLEEILQWDANFCDCMGNNVPLIAFEIEGLSEADILSIIIASNKLEADINHANNSGETPLSKALEKKMYCTACYIIENSPDLSPKEQIDKLPPDMLLYLASQNDNRADSSIKWYLAKYKNNINYQDENGKTALINAAEAKNQDSVLFDILPWGANPNICDSFSQTPLHKACINQDEAMISLLLNELAYPFVRDDFSNLPYDYLNDELKEKFKNKFESLKKIYENEGLGEITLPKTHFGPTKLTSSDVKQLFESKATDKEKKQEQLANLLCFAIEETNKAAMQSLEEDGDNLLLRATNRYCNSKDSYEKIMLLQAIKPFLNKKSRINTADDFGQTPIFKACAKGSLLLISLLVQNGASINIEDAIEKRPISYVPQDKRKTVEEFFEQYVRNS